MSKRDVTKFNHLTGNNPSMGTEAEYWTQLKHQISRVYEEAKEMYEAAQEEDLNGVVDGWADVMYTNEYVEDLLQAYGVNTKGVWQSVCDNNNTKFTQSYTYAAESKEALEEQGVDCYVEEVVFEGELWYCVKDTAENKVRKLKHHVSPSLEEFLPNHPL